MKSAIQTDLRHLVVSGALVAFSFMGIMSVFLNR
jgi:hypothetical protein